MYRRTLFCGSLWGEAVLMYDIYTLVLTQAAGFMIQTIPAAVLMWLQIPDVYRKKSFVTCCGKSCCFLLLLLPGFLAVTTAAYLRALDIFQSLADLYMVITILGFIMFSRRFLEMDWKKYLLTNLLGIQYEAIVVTVTGALVNEYVPEALAVGFPYHPGNVILMLAVNLVLFPPICLIARYVIGKNLVYIQGTVLLRGYFYVALSVLIFILSAVFLRPGILGQKLLFMGAVLICNVITYIVFFSEVGVSRRQVQLEEQMHLVETRYQMIRENVKKTRRMRHDMRHQINALKVLYEHKDWDGLGRFLRESEIEQKNLEEQDNTGGYLFLDSLLDYYKDCAAQKGIPMETEILTNCAYPFSMLDLTALVGNCMENALEACAGVEREKAFIRVQVRERDGRLLFWEENSCRSYERAENSSFQGWNGFRSQKRNGAYGIGLKSMDSIAKKYGGYLLCRQEKGIFTVKIELEIPGG